MRYHIWTIGCQMNIADSRRLAGELEELGYAPSDRPEDADVIVLNTCVVRQQAEDKVYGRLGSLKPIKADRPDTVIGLMGCLVGQRPSPEMARQFPHVDVFLKPSETSPLIEFLRKRQRADDLEQAIGSRPASAGSPTGTRPRESALDARARELELSVTRARHELQDAELARPVALPASEQGALVSAFVPVVLGCSWVCAYCIIPSRRGPERSRLAADVLRHVRSLVDQGVREVTLLGQIVDRYGHDRGEESGLAHLLEDLCDVQDLERIRFLTSHPSYITDELLEVVARQPKVMEHLEVPVQAGDDTVLSRMRRGYRVDDYRRLVDRIRHRVPGVAIHTDVIVGFPGETVAQFDATRMLLEELRLDKAHIAKFSPRPGTIAAVSMLDDVPPQEKERRRQVLDDIQTSINEASNRSLIGHAVDVLVEGSDRGRWRGRTRTNKIVFFEDPRPLHGKTVAVEIEWAGPWSMIGRADPTSTDGSALVSVDPIPARS